MRSSLSIWLLSENQRGIEMSISENELAVLEKIYKKVLGREKRYFSVDELIRESGSCPDELNEALRSLGEEELIEIKPFRMGRITHKGIMEVEGNRIPEKDKARQLVLARINELTSGDPDVYLNIDALAGELNMMRYELFDILNFLQGEGLVRILSRMSVAIVKRD